MMRNSRDLNVTFTSLMQLRNRICAQYEDIVKRKGHVDTYSFELYFILSEKDTTTRKILGSLGDDLEDFFKCSKIIIISEKEVPQMSSQILSAFKYKGSHREQNIEMVVMIQRTSKHKCVRCNKYNTEKEDQVCPKCVEFLPRDSTVPSNAVTA